MKDNKPPKMGLYKKAKRLAMGATLVVCLGYGMKYSNEVGAVADMVTERAAYIAKNLDNIVDATTNKAYELQREFQIRREYHEKLKDLRQEYKSKLGGE